MFGVEFWFHVTVDCTPFPVPPCAGTSLSSSICVGTPFPSHLVEVLCFPICFALILLFPTISWWYFAFSTADNDGVLFLKNLTSDKLNFHAWNVYGHSHNKLCVFASRQCVSKFRLRERRIPFLNGKHIQRSTEHVKKWLPCSVRSPVLTHGTGVTSFTDFVWSLNRLSSVVVQLSSSVCRQSLLGLPVAPSNCNDLEVYEKQGSFE